jgi:hypothetical protein
MPEHGRASLEIEAEIEPEAFALIQRGYLPRTPADKWLIRYTADGWLHMHRSQTGICVYLAHFAPHPTQSGFYTIDEAWVNRDSTQYKMKDLVYDAKLFIYLLRRLLLGHNVPFPVPDRMPHENKPLHEQHVMGQGGNDGDGTGDGVAPATFIPLPLL